MQYIKHTSDVQNIQSVRIAQRIASVIHNLEVQYQEIYDPCLHGWFVVCEQAQDILQTLPALTFSIVYKIQHGEAEYIEKVQDWYEVYILLNDNEGILAIIPTPIFEQHCLTTI